MILYFAGEGSDQITLQEKANILKTFAYKKEAVKAFNEQREAKTFLDSGAFSFFTKGKPVSLQEYADFIKEHQAKLTVASNLDVIGSWEGTQKNQQALEELDCFVLPVFHYKEPWGVLEQYVKDYQYIALGGLVPIAKEKSKMQAFLDKAFSIVKNRSFIHGFGINALWAWKRYPFYSVDASSWLAGPKFRSVLRFKNGELTTTNKDKQVRSAEGIAAHESHYHELARINLRAYREAADFTTELWAKRGITFPEHHGIIKRI